MTILTDEEIESINNDLLDRGKGSRIDFARAIESAVIEKIKARGAVAYQHRDGMLSCRLPGGGVSGIDWTPLYRIED